MADEEPSSESDQEDALMEAIGEGEMADEGLLDEEPTESEQDDALVEAILQGEFADEEPSEAD